MARKRKGRRRGNSQSSEVNVSIVRQSKAYSEGNKTTSRKRKPRSNTPQHRYGSNKPRVKKVKSSSSIELVRTLPCCSSASERKKYAKLGLDSALFFSSSKPAKRRKSHISVITITSSDDEDQNEDRTADWVSKMDMDTIIMSRTEEPFPSGDTDLWQSDSLTNEIIEAEKIRPRRSFIQMSSPPESSFIPMCASTPQQSNQISQALCFSMGNESDTTELEPETVPLIYRGPSFLESPMRNLNLNTSTISTTHIPYTTTSPQPYLTGAYKILKIPTSGSRFPRFYFGSSQPSRWEQQLEDSDLPEPGMHNISNNFETSATLDEGNEVRRLEQIPSSSQAPVSKPLLECALAKKSKSRSGPPSK